MNMRKFLLYIALASGVIAAASCSKEALDTAPSGSLSSEQIFENSAAAQSAIDGIYRLMYTNGWSEGWDDEHPGLAGFTITHSLMGEDHFQYSQGNGWFFFDYAFNISSDWTHTAGRQYGTWNMFYTFISLANYVIDNEATLTADAAGNDVLGQAYAIRAFSYYCLYECFCQGNYEVNKAAPGVPVYTKGTDKNTDGVGRGTIEQLFTRINEDFQKSVDFFKAGTGSQSHASHIDLYTAYGLWSRAALGQQNYSQAKTCAEEALKKPGLDRVATVAELGGFNNRAVGDVLWAFEITADQAAIYGSFISHMAKDGTYGEGAPQCFDYWLYETGMSDTDLRKDWAERESIVNSENVEVGYIWWQTKFKYQNVSTGVADIINLRAEELLLTLAECLVRVDHDYSGAREILNELYADRYSTTRDISGLTDSDAVSLNTHAAPVTILDEILLQRRIELWCEGMGRTPDLRRLNLGYSRSQMQSYPYDASPNDPNFIYAIPQAEFDSNPALDLATDQN